ncbi:LpxL/LpxP family acyltransferase, partial [Pseudomonas aeruginosa]
NLELCFPEMDEAQRERKVVGNFESLGMGLLETGMAWFWSDKRVKRWFNVSGINHLKMAQRDDRGVLVICDNRLVMRPYGEVFLNSLPPTPRTRDLKQAIAFLQAADTSAT